MSSSTSLKELTKVSSLWNYSQELCQSNFNHSSRIAGLSLFDATADIRECDDAILLCANTESELNISLHTRFDSNPPLRTCLDDVLHKTHLFNEAWLFSSEPRLVFAALAHDLVPAAIQLLLRCGRSIDFVEPCKTWQGVSMLDVGIENGGLISSVTEEEKKILLDPTIPLNSTEAARLFGGPAGSTLSQLTSADAELVSSCWKYNVPGKSVHVLRKSIENRPTAALRLSSGELVSWVLVRPDGSFGVLHCIDAYRGRGFAKIVVRFAALLLERLARSLGSSSAGNAASALKPYCHIKIGNEASEKVFRSLNFREVGYTSWVVSSKIAPRFSLRPLDPSNETEWDHLLLLINKSYRQDDAFFVDQQRTDLNNLKAMAKEGVFFLGYRLDMTILKDKVLSGVLDPSTGLSSKASSFNIACSMDAAGLVVKGQLETDELLCCVYIKVSSGSSSPFRHITSSASGKIDGEEVSVVPERKTASIGMLTIEPSLKKSGLGQRVLDFSLSTIKETFNCEAAECFVVSVKPWLQDWYKRNGFVIVGAEPWPEVMLHQLVLPCFFHHMRLDFNKNVLKKEEEKVASSNERNIILDAEQPPKWSPPAGVLLAPTMLPNKIEVSIHELPRLMRRDLLLVLPSWPISSYEGQGERGEKLYAICTAQRASLELVNWGPEAAQQKDFLLERFAEWANMVCDMLTKRGFPLCDFIDPCSGLPARTKGCTIVYPEVDAFETLLKYKTYNASGCRVISHPSWGTRIYPASVLAVAPITTLLMCVTEAGEALKNKQ
jgi:ribosomal protein S18 acetylase RimI-like enzyme